MWRIAGTTGSVGIEVAVSVGLGYYGGNYLDHKLGTQPWIMYLGILAGIGAATKALVRVTRDYRRDQGEAPDQAPDKTSPQPKKKDATDDARKGPGPGAH